MLASVRASRVSLQYFSRKSLRQISEHCHFSTKSDPKSIIFGEENVPFESFSLNPLLVDALAANNVHTATQIQSAAMPKLLDGKSLIIGAETGSGKTYAYMIPILHRVLTSEWYEKQQSGEKDRYPTSIIVVPNRELMDQTLRMTDRLLQHIPDSHSIAAVAVGADGVWPFVTHCPRVLFCTPNFLSSFVKGGRLLDAQVFRNLQTLVFDEADMLVDGSYLVHTERILEALKRTRREAIREGRLKVHERMLQVILSAATLSSQGARSVDKYIAHTFPHVERVTNPYLHKHHPLISQTYIKVSGDADDSSLVDSERLNILMHFLFNPNSCYTEDASSEQRARISHLDARDLSIDTSANRVAEPPVPTMIFADSAERVSELADAIRRTGVRCVEYHKLLHATKKQDALDQFRNGEVKLLLCSDAAARGLDIPDVKHVMQAEFAGNIVHHLHRIGRASRAGTSGMATILYDERSRELVESTISHVESGTVEQAFSRRRGFRKNIRRAAKFAQMAAGGDAEENDSDVSDEKVDGKRISDNSKSNA